MKNLIDDQPNRNSFSQFVPRVCVSLNARLCALDVAFARAECRTRVAVRQRRGWMRCVFWKL